MKRLQTLTLSYILPIAASLVMAYGYSQSGNTDKRLCEHQCALCNSTQGLLQLGDPTKTMCYCDVPNGLIMSTVPCDQLEAKTDEHGVQTWCPTAVK